MGAESQPRGTEETRMAHPFPQPDPGDDTGTPRWVKVQGIFVVLLLLVAIGMATGLVNRLSPFGLEGGGHGPAGDRVGDHAPSESGH